MVRRLEAEGRWRQVLARAETADRLGAGAVDGVVGRGVATGEVPGTRTTHALCRQLAFGGGPRGWGGTMSAVRGERVLWWRGGRWRRGGGTRGCRTGDAEREPSGNGGHYGAGEVREGVEAGGWLRVVRDSEFFGKAHNGA